MVTGESIKIPNREGQQLAATVIGKLAAPLVVLCHGMFSHKDGEKHQALSQRLHALGLNALRFDFTGVGESDGTFREMTYSREVEDLDAVINWLQTQGIERVGVYGSSLGGAVALLAAARDERIACLATLAAPAHPDRIDETHPNAVMQWEQTGVVDTENGPLARSFLDDSRAHDVAAATSVIRAPILIMHGDRDKEVNVSDAHDIAAAARHVSLEIVTLGDHRLTNPVQRKECIERIAQWFVEHAGRFGG